jgi:hypothetical protein
MEYTTKGKRKAFESSDCSSEQKLCCAELYADKRAPKKAHTTQTGSSPRQNLSLTAKQHKHICFLNSKHQ